jgi:hypothetical protein
VIYDIRFFPTVLIISSSAICILNKTWQAFMARRVGVFPFCSNNGYIPASFVLDNRQVNCLLFHCFPAYEVLISRYEATVRQSGTRSVSTVQHSDPRLRIQGFGKPGKYFELRLNAGYNSIGRYHTISILSKHFGTCRARYIKELVYLRD